MISKITHISLYVSNQDEALSFYKDKLGFKVHTDADFSGMRWLTLHAPNQSDFELVIFLATQPESQALIGKQAPEGPIFCLSSTDITGDYQALTAKGVQFSQAPETKPWGTDALFQDLYGNHILLVQA